MMTGTASPLPRAAVAPRSNPVRAVWLAAILGLLVARWGQLIEI